MTKVAAIICVRMSSARLPGKALCIYDEHTQKPNLICIVDRVRTSRYSPHVLVATSTGAEDDPIVGQCVKHGIPYFRGDLHNVVKRFDDALQTVGHADYVWRVMADNPLVDVGLVDHRIDTLIRYKADVVAPILPEPTYAAQSNIWSREAWDFCAKQSSGSLLEHPGEYLYESAGMFKTIYDPGPEAIYFQNIRTELDTPEDLEFFRAIWREHPLGNTRRILEWLGDHPEIVNINENIATKTSTTYLHGHHRARPVLCKECGEVVTHKVNDRLDISCHKCGSIKQFYI